ncbi:MAG: M48 family metalloprotease [Deltaproteobacteria bacterium]|nr:M48 family metalloprotease [Deltaproteobacteria bacterium]
MRVWSKTAITCLMVLLISGILPGKSQGITYKEEEALSREFLAVVASRFTFIKDPIIEAYVNEIGQRILEKVPTQPFRYHFYVIKEDVYNAFATPAGHIFINSGLVEAVKSEEELAGIIGHEIAHVVCRHISQNIDRSPKISLATLAGIAAGIFLGAAGAGDVGSAVVMGSMAAGQSAMLAYSREDELQADQLGLMYLYDSGYGGAGLLNSLKTIRSKQWFGTDQVPSYLMTHPASEDRMANIDLWLENNTIPEQKKYHPDLEAFQMMQATLTGKYGNESGAIKRFEARLRVAPEDPIANYGYALVLARVEKRKEAIAHLMKALEKKALNPYMLGELGRIYFMDGNYEKALRVLEPAVTRGPSDPDAMFFLARTHMELGQFEKASGILEVLTEKYPDFTDVYYFLGTAYGQQGNMEKAHYYLGVFYARRGKLKSAAFHLTRAQETATDPKRKAEIERLLENIDQRIAHASKRTQ